MCACLLADLRHEVLTADPWAEWSEELRAAGGGDQHIDTTPTVLKTAALADATATAKL